MWECTFLHTNIAISRNIEFHVSLIIGGRLGICPFFHEREFKSISKYNRTKQITFVYFSIVAILEDLFIEQLDRYE